MKNFTLRTNLALAIATLATFVTATAFARTGKQDFVLHVGMIQYKRNRGGREIDDTEHSVRNDSVELILAQ